MPTLKSQSCTELWDIAYKKSNKSHDLIEVRLDRTSPTAKSFMFYTIEGKDEEYSELEQSKIAEIEGLILSTRNQFLEEKDLYKIHNYPSLYCFCVRRIGSFYVYIKRHDKKNNFKEEAEEEIFITPYTPTVVIWLKKYNQSNKETLADLQKGIGDGKRYLPICNELNDAISETEKLIKKISK